MDLFAFFDSIWAAILAAILAVLVPGTAASVTAGWWDWFLGLFS